MKLGYLFLSIIVLSSVVSSFDAVNSSSGERTLSGYCQVINISGKYVLDRDIVRRPEVDTPKPTPQGCTPEKLNSSDAFDCYPETACLEIKAPNVSIDCQGHKIVIGDWIQDGILMDIPNFLSSNVTIRNCVIDRPYRGIVDNCGVGGSFVNNSVDNAIRDDHHSQNTLGGICRKIDYPGEYVLTEDMVRRPEVDTPMIDRKCLDQRKWNQSNMRQCLGYQLSACLTIESADVTVDCQGHSIVIGDWIQNGITIWQPAKNVTIKNCKIDRPYSGIDVYWDDSYGNNFMNNSIYNVAEFGYRIMGYDSVIDCQGSKISDVFLTMRSFRNLTIGKSNNTVKNCIVGAINDYGSGSTIINNSIGVIMIVGHETVVSGNLVVRDEHLAEWAGGVAGFYIYGYNNSIIGNTVRGASGSCFWIESEGSNFISNKAEQCKFGFYIYSGDNNTFIGNEATENIQDGFTIYWKSNNSGNVFSNNIARNNGRYGFNLDDSKNTFGDNIDEGNPYGSLLNNRIKEFFDGISMWFKSLFGG